ncbi:HI1506-related protein [Pseudomonas chlororaphis]|uniref:HI1506-related protein n=1 Tax=Pseudomonas chlororaphis TaxID=587753 RepID=UPI001B3085D6|nr:HI1506-related protein [Pseudomonas chlororaphis]MBP5056346.1 hypothetical protein [Pseudomonas chlororaphis]MBP5141759.1 hypothetical protein [Pseudomonas chlororaphis]QTT98497.1 hypothetical protein HUT26_04145 [Pseudomonas chlororaphis]
MATVVTIISKRNGFRRCGVAHSDQPKDWPEDAFTDEQWDALFAEPQLILAVKEDGLDLVSEQRYESTSTISSSLPEAPDTPQATQPQALEASAAPVGDALDGIWREVLGNEQPGADDLVSDGPDQVARDGQASDPAPTSADAADQAAEQAQDAEETPAKPAKTRTAKSRDDAK